MRKPKIERVNKNTKNKINIQNIGDVRFRVTTVKDKTVDPKTGEILDEKQYAVLVKEFVKEGVTEIDQFNAFIWTYKFKGYNTMRKYAVAIQRFLNFILINNENFGLTSFADIEANHGIQYLETNITNKGLSLNYFNQEQRALDKFYEFLAKRKLLNHVTIEDFTDIEYTTKRGKKAVRKSILYTSTPPKKINIPPLHHMHPNLLLYFFETAKKVAPRIALGIYLQIFGLLRASEVVNVTKQGIRFGETGLFITLKQEIISTGRKKDHTFSGIKQKKPAHVPHQGDLLNELLEFHIENKFYTNNGTGALFANAWGNTMSYQNYNRYFNKVKKEFIKRLLNSDLVANRQHGLLLTTARWSTHIGRGIGSNLVAEDRPGDIQFLQLRRRDSSPESSQEYIFETTMFTRQLNEVATMFFE